LFFLPFFSGVARNVSWEFRPDYDDDDADDGNGGGGRKQ